MIIFLKCHGAEAQWEVLLHPVGRWTRNALVETLWLH